MDELLSAEDWLKQEELENPFIRPIWGNSKGEFRGYNVSTIMERYANYKNRQLDVLIMQFRIRLDKYQLSKENSTEGIEASYWLKEFDNHFGIKIVRLGEL